MNELGKKAVLMRFSAGLPGETRQDRRLTQEVKSEKSLGEQSGKWNKNLYPPEALKDVKAKINEARAYHDSVTLPFDTGIGILPGVLLPEYGEKMRLFKSQIERLFEDTFLAEPERWIEWARAEHDGTFEPANYPGCSNEGFEPEAFRMAMRKKCYVRCEPLPVPDSTHFESTVSNLLGADTASVDAKVRDASAEAQKELMRRILAPVKHMAETLSADKPRIYETLTGNIAEICRLAPALNLTDDPTINVLLADVKALTSYAVDGLRDSKDTRDIARRQAEEVLRKLEGYKI
jgi:hypothetical protein